MKIDQALCFAAWVAFPGALYAESCSGGVGGGMDITGNDCSDVSWQTNDSTVPVAPVAAITAAAMYERALAEYEIGHYAQAIGHFRVAAGLGEMRAPVVLALMYRMGERLYGDQVHADAPEAARWAAIAVDRYRAAGTERASLRD